MNTTTWHQIKSILEQVLEQPQPGRHEFLARACAGNAALRAEVDALLGGADEHAESFLEIPPALPTDDEEAMDGEEADAAWINRNVGPLRIIRKIASGGMGRVFLARREGAHHEDVVVKAVRSELDSPALRCQLERERRLQATLDHPCIARLIEGDFGIDDQPVVVMEHIDGQPIDVFCRNHRLGVRARITLFLDACSAVEYLHAKRIVHRDIKPSNLLVTADGQPKLIDFGIASLCASDSEPEASGMALETLAVFTPGYAAPEQVRNRSVTPAGDVYGLGALLYRLLTGQAPHGERRSTSSLEMMRVMCEGNPERASLVVRQRTAEPDAGLPVAGRLSRLLSGGLDHILAKALASQPRDRYRSVVELAADLRRYLASPWGMARRGVARKPRGASRTPRALSAARERKVPQPMVMDEVHETTWPATIPLGNVCLRPRAALRCLRARAGREPRIRGPVGH